MTAPTQQLLYLVYGANTAYHDEARFSILSALYRAADADAFFISVYTDAPQHYADLPVRVRALSAEELQQWYGSLHYHHRSKLCALQQAVKQADKTVFVDTDTFFLRDPAYLFAAVNDDTCLADELYFGALPDTVATDTAVAEQLALYGINPKSIPIINSGLFGITRNNAVIIDRALALNDVVYPASQKSLTTEQLVLGIAASSQTQLVDDAAVIKHYWSRKQLFRAKAQAFLARHGSDWRSESAHRDFLRVTPVLPKPPVLVRTLAKIALALVPSPKRQLWLELFYSVYPYANPFDRACRAVWREKAWENYRQKMAQRNHAA